MVTVQPAEPASATGSSTSRRRSRCRPDRRRTSGAAPPPQRGPGRELSRGGARWRGARARGPYHEEKAGAVPDVPAAKGAQSLAPGGPAPVPERRRLRRPVTSDVCSGRQLFGVGRRHHLERVQHAGHEAIVADDPGQLDDPGHAVAVLQRVEDRLVDPVLLQQLPHVRDDRSLLGREAAGVLPVAHHADRFLARSGLARQRHVRAPDVRAVLLTRGGEDGQLALLGLHRRLEAKVVAGADHPLAHLRAVHHEAEGTTHAAAALRDRVEDRLMLLGHLFPGRDGRRSRHSGLLSVFLSGFYSSLDVAAADGAVSLPVSDQGSNAYTDVNTLLEQHAGRRPDKIVVESPDQDARITYGEIEALTRRFANFLADEGVRPGDRISLLSDNGIEPLIVFWGAMRAGVIVNPVNVEIREKHVSQILHDVAPKAV